MAARASISAAITAQRFQRYIARLGANMKPEQVLSQFPDLSALVIGDICLDRWCTYNPALTEPSRETGIPRLAVVSTVLTPGAGGTVAGNLRSLRTGRVEVLGIRGTDGHGMELERALQERGIGTTLMVPAPEIPTFTYTKILTMVTGEEDQPRVDFVYDSPIPADVEWQVLDRIEASVRNFDVVLVSDQAETAQGGVITPAVRDLVAKLSASHPEKVFWVDSRERIEHFRGVVVKPNRREADEACRRVFGCVDLPRLRTHVNAPAMIVTLGHEGALVVDAAGSMKKVQTRSVENPVDICGAGDSFSAAAAMALAVTRSAATAAQFGNAAASVTIMKKGTATVSPKELEEALTCRI
jgi:rfaE bifunctional protein kinase chain/domain